MEQNISHKMSMGKKSFRIGDLAKELRVKKFVIRFWEKEFKINSDRSDGGQRFYTQEDLDKFLQIKDLLYNKKFTIKGAKKQLEHPVTQGDYCQVFCPIENNIEQKNNFQEKFQATNLITEKTDNINPATKIENNKEFFEKLVNLKEKLINLKENLN